LRGEEAAGGGARGGGRGGGGGRTRKEERRGISDFVRNNNSEFSESMWRKKNIPHSVLRYIRSRGCLYKSRRRYNLSNFLKFVFTQKLEKEKNTVNFFLRFCFTNVLKKLIQKWNIFPCVPYVPVFPVFSVLPVFPVFRTFYALGDEAVLFYAVK
jgi:hypothetical protein